MRFEVDFNSSTFKNYNELKKKVRDRPKSVVSAGVPWKSISGAINFWTWHLFTSKL